MGILFLIIILVFASVILYICREKNAWDVLAFNSVLGICSLFAIGVLKDSNEIWLRIISFLGLVAISSAFASIFNKKS